MKQIIEQFQIKTNITDIKPLKIGHINDSYVLSGQNPEDESYFLQKINHSIFKDVEGLQRNIQQVTDHLRKKYLENGNQELADKVLQLVQTKDGKWYHKDATGDYWRIYINIKNTHSYEAITADLAHAAGVAFGNFHKMLVDIPKAKLIETIPNFHNVAFRVKQLRDAASADAAGRLEKTRWMLEALYARAEEMCRPQELFEKGIMPARVNHCDTKINNMLFDADDKPCSIVDLDTVMVGFVLSDFGDFMRTAANTGAEDDKNLDNIDVNLEIYKAYTQGYLSTADFLQPVEIENLALGAKMLTYMQTVRFYADYLNGDTYYKIEHPEHNWQRSLAQFRLLEKQEEKFGIMQQIVNDCI